MAFKRRFLSSQGLDNQAPPGCLGRLGKRGEIREENWQVSTSLKMTVALETSISVKYLLYPKCLICLSLIIKELLKKSFVIVLFSEVVYRKSRAEKINF